MKYIFTFLVLVFIFSCKPKPDFDNIPTLKFESVSKNLVLKGDTLFINLSFTDGDGDIGFPDGYDQSNRFLQDKEGFIVGKAGAITDTTNGKTLNVGNLLVTNSLERDPRLANTPEIPSKGNVKSISGIITMKLPFMQCPNPSHNYDTVIYSIQLIDRADHSSNTITTSSIIYKCK